MDNILFNHRYFDVNYNNFLQGFSLALANFEQNPQEKKQLKRVMRNERKRK